MVTLARGTAETPPSALSPAASGHAAHDHESHEHDHSHTPRPVAGRRMSLLRMGLPLRLSFAAGAALLLWSAIALGLS